MTADLVPASPSHATPALHTSSLPASLEDLTPCDHAPHPHRSVSGGALRAATFGAMDGLVSNSALLVGVLATHPSTSATLLTGVAALAAGAFSMATGEYTSVSTQNESIQSELAHESEEIRLHPDREVMELAAAYEAKGLSSLLALQVAFELTANHHSALAAHAVEELGVDPSSIPSPWTATISSFVSFALGALIPLLSILLAPSALLVSLVSGAFLALFGLATSRYTGRGLLFSATRQLALGALSFGATFLIGALASSLF